MSHILEPNMTAPTSTQENVIKDNLADAIAAHIMDQDPPLEVVDVEAWWPVRDKEYACDLMDSSLYKKQGCILQFINNNALGMSSLLGGIRIVPFFYFFFTNLLVFFWMFFNQLLCYLMHFLVIFLNCYLFSVYKFFS